MKLFLCLVLIGLVNANGTPSPSSVPSSTMPLTTSNGDTTQLPSMTSAGTESISTTLPLSTTAVQSDINKNVLKVKPVAQNENILGIVGTEGAENLEKKTKVETGVNAESNVNNNINEAETNNKIVSIKSNIAVSDHMNKVPVEELLITDTSKPLKQLAETQNLNSNPLNNEVTVANEDTLNRNSGDTSNNITSVVSNCNVKNSTCVPTREELVAAGVSNPDMMQHGANILPKLLFEETPKSNTPAAELSKPGCNVKNSTCVPTREELEAAGVSNPDMMQHGANILPKLLLEETPKTNTPTAELSEPGCNVKNSTCVPTGEELIAAGVSNPDMMQHGANVLPKLLSEEKPNTNKPPVDPKPNKPGCNVKNGTCVPTEKELNASGVDLSGLVGQYSIDTENLFLGQSKQSVSKVIEDPIAETPKKEHITSSQATVDKITAGSDNTNTKQIEGALAKASVIEITEAMKPTTVQQIPGPSKTTQQTILSLQSTANNVIKTSTETSPNMLSPKKTESKETTQGLTTSAVTAELASADVQTTRQTTELYTCPIIKCKNTCVYGRKVNSDGCETCECKFDNGCPRVSPVSRLLCLLRANTSQSCQSDADCRRNRICCPGTCGPICRRPSRSRSMLLSMLVD